MRGGLASEPSRGEGQETLAGEEASARAGATGAGMESADSPWGDMVRTATARHACSSCSCDNSTSTLPAVGEATSMICRVEGAQERAAEVARCEDSATATATSIVPGTAPSACHVSSKPPGHVVSVVASQSPATRAHALNQSAT